MNDTFDVTRATAIIQHGIKHGMIETMPQSDGDKIMEAEKLVELARQVEVVRAAWIANGGEEVARERVPMWPVAEEILVEANLFVGSNGTPIELPSAPPSSGEESESSEPTSSAPTLDAPPSQDLPSTPSQSDGESSGQATSQESVPPSPVPSTSPGEPVKDEVWADPSGTEWLVLAYTGGPSIEVQKVSTGESTVAPAGMLKRKVAGAPPPDDYEGPMTSCACAIKMGKGPMVLASECENCPSEQEETAPQTDISTGEPVREVEVVVTPDLGKPDEPVVPERPLVDVVVTDVPEHDDEGDDRYQILLSETESDYTPSGMPIPHDLADPPDIKPENFDEVDDRTARALHSKYNALAARAKFLHDVEDARARECKMVLTLFMHGARRIARDKLGNSATVTELEGWAEENDENVSTWKDRANKHAKRASAYKTFFDIYTQHVVVLSRDWSMRDKQMNS